MIIAYLGAGIISGILATFIALALGAPLYMCLLIYMVVGNIAVSIVIGVNIIPKMIVERVRKTRG